MLILCWSCHCHPYNVVAVLILRYMVKNIMIWFCCPVHEELLRRNIVIWLEENIILCLRPTQQMSPPFCLISLRPNVFFCPFWLSRKSCYDDAWPTPCFVSVTNSLSYCRPFTLFTSSPHDFSFSRKSMMNQIEYFFSESCVSVCLPLQLFETANKYHFYHSLALLGAAHCGKPAVVSIEA